MRFFLLKKEYYTKNIKILSTLYSLYIYNLYITIAYISIKLIVVLSRKLLEKISKHTRSAILKLLGERFFFT